MYQGMCMWLLQCCMLYKRVLCRTACWGGAAMDFGSWNQEKLRVCMLYTAPLQLDWPESSFDTMHAESTLLSFS